MQKKVSANAKIISVAILVVAAIGLATAATSPTTPQPVGHDISQVTGINLLTVLQSGSNAAEYRGTVDVGSQTLRLVSTGFITLTAGLDAPQGISRIKLDQYGIYFGKTYEQTPRPGGGSVLEHVAALTIKENSQGNDEIDLRILNAAKGFKLDETGKATVQGELCLGGECKTEWPSEGSSQYIYNCHFTSDASNNISLVRATGPSCIKQEHDKGQDRLVMACALTTDVAIAGGVDCKQGNRVELTDGSTRQDWWIVNCQSDIESATLTCLRQN